MSRPNGWTVYDGPGLDGAPIIGVITGTARPSANVKTGPMAQLWVLAREVTPPRAHADRVPGNGCSGCPLVEACYVDRGKAPRAVWDAWHRGAYPVWPGTVFTRALRFGAYGDPASLPVAVAESLAVAAPKGRTGYTHLWRTLTGRTGHRWKRLLMASVEDDASEALARRRGWRTFRVAPAGADAAPVPGAILCPADSHGVQCADCRLCDGAPRGRADRRPSIWIPAHGRMAARLPAKDAQEATR